MRNLRYDNYLRENIETKCAVREASNSTTISQTHTLILLFICISFMAIDKTGLILSSINKTNSCW